MLLISTPLNLFEIVVLLQAPPTILVIRHAFSFFPFNFQKQLFSLELDKMVYRESKYLLLS